jgi:hypothetical protein
MRLFMGIMCVFFTFIAHASRLQNSIQYLTPLGPDVGFLIENPSSNKMTFNLNVKPKACPSLGLDSMKLRGSMSSIDSYGEIEANDFMVAYYSLGTYNYNTPCLLDVYLETIVNGEIEEISITLDTNHSPNGKKLNNKVKGIKTPLIIKHSFKRMNETHYELTLLLQNRSLKSQLIELERIEIDCKSGDVFLKQTDNFPDGIKNGRSEIKEQSWRAYKIIYKSSKESFNCTSTAIFSGTSHEVLNYSFQIEKKIKTYMDAPGESRQ